MVRPAGGRFLCQHQLVMLFLPAFRKAASARLAALAVPGGIAGCGNSQNCVRACPQEIPLTTSLAKLNREANRLALSRLLGAGACSAANFVVSGRKVKYNYL